ncbi:MAG: hypothetical protein LC792_21660, partial [Actinobacteria bacterium]|nr:hypothetical protein [Actinomycetota bacterium]
MTASPWLESRAPRSPRRVLSPLFTAVLCVASLLVLARPAAAAPLPAAVMRGYVPLEANATQKTMEGVRS